MKSFIKTTTILILMVITISECLPKTQIPKKPTAISDNNASTTAIPTNTLTPTETQRLTNTNSPKPESTKTATFTITPPSTSTITPQPTKDYFKDAVVLNVGYLGNNQLLVVLETKYELEDVYFASIGDEIFQCEILDEYPKRLYCNGNSVQIGQIVAFIIHAKASEVDAFSVEIFVPKLPTATPKSNNNSGGDRNPNETDGPPPDPDGTPKSGS